MFFSAYTQIQMTFKWFPTEMHFMPPLLVFCTLTKGQKRWWWWWSQIQKQYHCLNVRTKSVLFASSVICVCFSPCRMHISLYFASCSLFYRFPIELDGYHMRQCNSLFWLGGGGDGGGCDECVGEQSSFTHWLSLWEEEKKLQVPDSIW